MYPTVEYSYRSQINIVDNSAVTIPEFFAEDIKAVNVKIGEDFTWTLPDLNDAYTIKSIGIVNAEVFKFVTFD